MLHRKLDISWPSDFFEKCFLKSNKSIISCNNELKSSSHEVKYAIHEVIPWVVSLYVERPRALASALSNVQVDKHGIPILYHLHQCRPCTS